MKLLISIVSFITIVLLLNGCTGYGKFMKATEKYPPTNAKNIHIYSIEQPESKYQILGYISVYSSDAQDAGNDLKAKLKAKGAELGADAIMSFKLNINIGGGGGAEGIAIKYQ